MPTASTRRGVDGQLSRAHYCHLNAYSGSERSLELDYQRQIALKSKRAKLDAKQRRLNSKPIRLAPQSTKCGHNSTPLLLSGARRLLLYSLCLLVIFVPNYYQQTSSAQHVTSNGQQLNARENYHNQRHHHTGCNHFSHKSHDTLRQLAQAQQVSPLPISSMRPQTIDGRRQRHTAPTAFVETQPEACTDCLAIPLVAMMGNKRVSGFLIPTLAKNYRGHNLAQQKQQQQHQQPQRHRHIVYDKSPILRPPYYSSTPPMNDPLAPHSDAQCPMTGPLTVCDRIGSYPADVILRKLDTAKEALKQSNFNLDSLFSDEREHLSDPFENESQPATGVPEDNDDSSGSANAHSEKNKSVTDSNKSAVHNWTQNDSTEPDGLWPAPNYPQEANSTNYRQAARVSGAANIDPPLGLSAPADHRSRQAALEQLQQQRPLNHSHHRHTKAAGDTGAGGNSFTNEADLVEHNQQHPKQLQLQRPNRASQLEEFVDLVERQAIVREPKDSAPIYVDAGADSNADPDPDPYPVVKDDERVDGKAELSISNHSLVSQKVGAPKERPTALRGVSNARRSRRQVSVQVSRQLGDSVASTAASGPTSEPGAEQTNQVEPVCRAKSIYISPRAALNDKKQWKYVVNAPERNPLVRQIIRVDICEDPFGPCSDQVTIPFGFSSQCKQKYAKKKLLALDSQSGLLEVDTFFIPSCCVCQLIRDRPTFGSSAAPDTPPGEKPPEEATISTPDTEDDTNLNSARTSDTETR